MLRLSFLIVPVLFFSGCFRAEVSSTSSIEPSQQQATKPISESSEKDEPVEMVAPKLSKVSGGLIFPEWEQRFKDNVETTDDGAVHMNNYKDYKISASYRAVLTTESMISNFVTYPLMGASVTDVKVLNHKPRNSGLNYVVGEGWKFEHVELPAGWYCFVFGWSPNTFQCVWKEIKSGENVEFDVEISTADRSRLVVTSAQKSKVWFHPVCPAELEWDEDVVAAFSSHRWSMLPWDPFRIDYSLDAGKQLTLIGMAPGEYRVFCLVEGGAKAQLEIVRVESDQETLVEFEE